MPAPENGIDSADLQTHYAIRHQVTGVTMLDSRRFTAAVAALVGVAIILIATTVEAQRAVTGVRLGEHPEATRLVLDLSEAMPFRVFTLESPYRVVIDLPDTSWKATSNQLAGRGVIAGLRYGLFQPGTFRVVLDANEPVKVESAYVLGPNENAGHRLVLDMRGVSRERFAPADMGDYRPASFSIAAPADAIRRRPGFAGGDKPVIVIDPGHGGVDPGAIGRTTGVYEKAIALNAARILRDRLEKTGRFRVHLTRDSDMFLRLQERVGIARAHNADLFISIHADANPILSVQGLSVYTLSNDASDREAEALAQRENKADLIAGVDLSEERPELINILLDLALRETMNLSARYANMLIDDLAGRTTLLRRSHRFAGFAVLKAPDVPSVLIELGHLSNAEDERLLQRRAHLEAIADGIVKATERFFDYRIALRRS